MIASLIDEDGGIISMDVPHEIGSNIGDIADYLFACDMDVFSDWQNKRCSSYDLSYMECALALSWASDEGLSAPLNRTKTPWGELTLEYAQ